MVLFNKESASLDQNVLVIRIQPDEGISLRMQAKMPGTSFRIEPVKMDFHYGTSFGKASPGSVRTAAARCDERRRHAFRAPRRSRGSVGLHRPDRRGLGGEGESAGRLFCQYPAGSWGPEEADELAARDDGPRVAAIVMRTDR